MYNKKAIEYLGKIFHSINPDVKIDKQFIKLMGNLGDQDTTDKFYEKYGKKKGFKQMENAFEYIQELYAYNP